MRNNVKNVLFIPLMFVIILTTCMVVVNAAEVSNGSLQRSTVENQKDKGFAEAGLPTTNIPTVAFKTTSELTPLAAAQGNEGPSSPLTVDSWQEEDYSANLHPENYLSYYSDTDDFFFSYPPHLYFYTESSYEPFETKLGRNVETHILLGKKGSALVFSLYDRLDNLNLKAAKDRIFASEAASITEKRTTLLDETDKKKRFSRFVVTGYNDDKMIVYKLVKVTPSNVMLMRIECPPYLNHDDEMEKRYVQECIYRYCGFAKEELDSPRSYTEFLQSDKK